MIAHPIPVIDNKKQLAQGVLIQKAPGNKIDNPAAGYTGCGRWHLQTNME